MRAACTLMRSLEPSAAILARTSIRYRRRGAPSPSRCEARWWAWEPVRRLVQLAAFSAVLRRVCGLLGLLRWAWSWSIASARLISSFCSKENPRVKPLSGGFPILAHTFDPPCPSRALLVLLPSGSTLCSQGWAHPTQAGICVLRHPPYVRPERGPPAPDDEGLVLWHSGSRRTASGAQLVR